MSDYTSTAAAFLPVSVEDCKTHMNVSHATDDGLIDTYIRAATAMLEARSNRCFITQTRKCVMNGFDDKRYVHSRTITLPRSPVRSISSITYVNTSAGTTSTLASSDYVVSIYARPGIIREAYSATWPSVREQPDNVTITYVTGHSTVPSGIPYNIRLAIEQVVAHWYRNRESHLEQTFSEVPLGVAALLESEHLETYA